MNLARHELGFSKTASRFPTKGTCLAIYSRAVNAELPLDEVLRDAFPWCAGWRAQLRDLFAAYVEAKQAQNVLDYDDLLLYWAQTVAEPALADDIGGRFDHVLVDEYQDTNRLQSSILLALKPGGRGLTVVGDDASRFIPSARRPSATSSISPTPSAPPPTSSRSNATIARRSRSWPRPMGDRTRPRAFHQESLDRAPIGGASANRQRARRGRSGPLHRPARAGNRETGASLKQQRCCFRASHHSGPLELELTRRNIPFVKFGGLKFLDSAHVKDMLAVLRFAQNPRDRVAGFRIMQLMPGVGPSTARRALDLMAERPDPISALSEIPAPRARATTGPASSRRYKHLRSGKAGWPAEIAARGAGTSRGWKTFTTTPPRASPTCCNSNRSRRAIPRASASSPN